MSKQVFEIEVGCLYYGTLREYLRQMKFKGYSLQWMEGSGWWSRTFLIKSDNPTTMAVLKRDLVGWEKSLASGANER